MTANSILAHQGGWDEILIIVGPLALIVWVVALVRYRMRREDEKETSTETDAVAS